MSQIDYEQLGELLSAYLDGELDTEQTEVVERMLREDAGPRRLLEELRHTVKLVSSLPRHTAPSGIAEDLRVKVERSELLGDSGAVTTAGGRSSPLPALLSMAAALCVIAVGWWMFTVGDGTATGPQLAQVDAERGKATDEPTGPRGHGISSKRAAPGPEVLTDKSSSASPAVPRRVQEERLVASASFDQKVKAGMGVGVVRTHAFKSETTRLRLFVRNEAERDEVAARVVGYLRSRKVPDLARFAPDGRAEPAPSSSFYYQGKPVVNFAEAEEKQILVRASRGQLDGLLADLGDSARRSKNATLRSGAVSVRGLDRARAALSMYETDERAPVTSRADSRDFHDDKSVAPLATEKPEVGPGEHRIAKADWPADDLLRAIGMPEETLAWVMTGESEEGTPAESGAIRPGEPVTNARVELDKTTADAGDARSGGEKRVGHKLGAFAPVAEGDVGLVEKRLKAAVRARRESPARHGARNIGSGPVAEEKAEKGKAPASAPKTRVVRPPSSEAYITLVVELIIGQPDAAKARDRGQPPSDAKHK